MGSVKAREAIKHSTDPDSVHGLPCPFCGSIRLKLITFPDAPSYELPTTKFLVYCRECMSDGPAKFSDAAAIMAWNQRSGT